MAYEDRSFCLLELMLWWLSLSTLARLSAGKGGAALLGVCYDYGDATGHGDGGGDKACLVLMWAC